MHHILGVIAFTHKVVLQVNKYHAPYVLTKPIHPSQQLLRQSGEGIVIRIDVVLNFELERELLGFGDLIRILAPQVLVSRIRKRLEHSISQYQTSQQ